MAGGRGFLRHTEFQWSHRIKAHFSKQRRFRGEFQIKEAMWIMMLGLSDFTEHRESRSTNAAAESTCCHWVCCDFEWQSHGCQYTARIERWGITSEGRNHRHEHYKEIRTTATTICSMLEAVTTANMCANYPMTSSIQSYWCKLHLQLSWIFKKVVSIFKWYY